MVIYVKNPRLKRIVYRQLSHLHNMALKCYKVGKMAKGKEYENKADKLYKQNYYKIFSIKRR